jgi:hypothetical protein
MVLIFLDLMEFAICLILIFMYDVCHFEKIREDGLDRDVFSVRIIPNRQEQKL